MREVEKGTKKKDNQVYVEGVSNGTETEKLCQIKKKKLEESGNPGSKSFLLNSWTKKVYNRFKSKFFFLALPRVFCVT